MAINENSPITGPGEADLDDRPGVTVTENNKYKGTLTVEATDGMIKSINEEAESELDKALGITFDSIGAASSWFDFADDPAGTALGAAFGWVIEHVDDARKILDGFAGNPALINQIATEHKNAAIALRALANDVQRNLVHYWGWEGEASDAYRASMQDMVNEVNTAADAAETHGKVVTVMGLIITIGRDMLRDMIAKAAGSIVSKAVLGAVASVFTAGVTAALGAGKVAGKIAKLVADLSTFAAKLVKGLVACGNLIKRIEPIFESLKGAWEKFDNVADVAEVSYESYNATKEFDKYVDEAVAEEDAKGVAENDKRDLMKDAKKAQAEFDEYVKYKEQEKAGAEYVDEKGKALDKEAKEVQDANADVNTAVDEANKYAKDAEKYGKEANKYAEESKEAAERGDQKAFDEAQRKYDAAVDKHDAAADKFKDAETKVEDKKAIADDEHDDLVKAADEYASASLSYAKDASWSKNELNDTTKPFADLDKASDEFHEKYDMKEEDIAESDIQRFRDVKAATEDLDTKTEQAQKDHAAYEAANYEAADKNADAAVANAKALKTGDEDDIKAAEEATEAASKANDDLKDAGTKFDTSAKDAKDAGTYYESLDRDFKNKNETPAPGKEPNATIKKQEVKAL